MRAYDADNRTESLVRATPRGLGAGSDIARGMGTDGPVRGYHLGGQEEGPIQAADAVIARFFLRRRRFEGHEPGWASAAARL